MLFDSTATGGGLYIQAEANQASGLELAKAVEAYNAGRSKYAKEPLTTEYFSGDNPQRLYGAIPIRIWVNLAERNERGMVVRDIRVEISVGDLQGNNDE
ncbi:MAG: Pyridoxamine 5-phosphate oxidase [Candidatus Saccharibacteria bacterium]|nr:Pyridoxamine 5-phosphate oxidase [Candidatus Saccharibacteria bacterium]